MTNKVPVITFIGHVDHGKSSLLGRLTLISNSGTSNMTRQFDEGLPTAHLLDQLQEERERDMTIDTSSLTLVLKGRRVECIDCPGHFELVKNMVSGTTRADVAVLLLDVTKGIAPQTIRHFEIIQFLGLPKCIVAINKLDLVKDPANDFERACADINKRFGSSKTKIEAIVPVSALKGWGIEGNKDFSFYQGPGLIDALLEAIVRPHQNPDPLLFPVQQIVGGWCLGTVKSGMVERGDVVELGRSGRKARILGIKDFPMDIERAVAPHSVALQLDCCEEWLQDEILTDSNSRYIRVNETSSEIVWLEPHEKLTADELTISAYNQKCKVQLQVENNGSGHPSELGYGDIGKVTMRLEQPFLVFDGEQQKGLNRFVLSRRGQVVAGGFLACGN